MATALGLIGLVAFIVAVIALAAGVTFAVIKLSPGERSGKRSTEPAQPS